MKKLGIIAGLLFITACGGPPPEISGPVSVETASLVAGTIEDSSDFIASLNSRQSVGLKPRVSGQIAQILVKQGDTVENNSPLLIIDPSQQAATVQSNVAQVATAQAEVASRAAALQSAKASLESARASLTARQASRLERVSSVALQRRDAQRDRELFKDGVISQRNLENRINSLEIAEAALKTLDREIEAQRANVTEAEANIIGADADLRASQQRLQQSQSNTVRERVELQFHQVAAPFAGTVGNIPIKVGDFVSNTTELLTLTQNDQLEVEIAVPVERASQLKDGLQVKVLDDQNKPIGQGSILFISPTVNPQSQSVLVKAGFDNSQKQLRQDQLVRVRIVWNNRPGVKIPITAIARQAGRSFVYVTESIQDKSGKTKTVAKQRTIELGKVEENQQEVISGLKSQDQIVTTGIQFLNDGAEITTQKPQQKS